MIRINVKHNPDYKKYERNPTRWCRICNRRLGHEIELPDNVCWFCKRRLFITDPNYTMYGRPYIRDECNNPIGKSLNSHAS